MRYWLYIGLLFCTVYKTAAQGKTFCICDADSALKSIVAKPVHTAADLNALLNINNIDGIYHDKILAAFPQLLSKLTQESEAVKQDSIAAKKFRHIDSINVVSKSLFSFFSNTNNRDNLIGQITCGIPWSSIPIHQWFVSNIYYAGNRLVVRVSNACCKIYCRMTWQPDKIIIQWLTYTPDG